MIPYHRGFTPPAPALDVWVGHPARAGRTVQLCAKLDTGADTTVVPNGIVQRLGLTARSYAWLRSYDGSYSRRPVYYARLDLSGFVLFAVRCVAAERDTVLLGRNVLNRFTITLDGKRLTFDIQQ